METLLTKRLLFAGVMVMAVSIACSSAGGGAATDTAQPTSAPEVETVTAEPTAELTSEPTAEATTQATEAAGAAGKTINAGEAIAVFGPYTITAAAGWTDTHQVAAGVVNTLILTKGANSLMISQAAGGGGECHFDGVTGAEGQTFPSGVGISGASGQFMRGTNDGGLNWTICQKGPDTFGFPTNFGYVTYKGTSAIDDAALAEMDGMVASLKE